MASWSSENYSTTHMISLLFPKWWLLRWNLSLSHMELRLVFKLDGIVIQSHSWLFQLLRLLQCQQSRYPGARIYEPYVVAFLEEGDIFCVSTWLLHSVVLILIHSTDRSKFLSISRKSCPISWGCKIYRLPLCRRISPFPQRVSWIWH